MKTHPTNRYLILLAAGVLAAVLGSEYIWSIYSDPLRELHGWTPGQVTATYSLFTVFSMAGMFFYILLSRFLAPRYIALLGGTMQGGGFLLSGFSNSLPLLYFSYAVIGGIGNGLLYNGSVSVATDWFPDKKGTASGICTGFLGLAPILWSLAGSRLIEAFDVRISLRIIGSILIMVSWLSGWLIERAPEAYYPEGWDAGTETHQPVSRNYRPSEIIRTPLFYCVVLYIFFACSAGLSMTGNIASISMETANLTMQQAAIQVALLSVGSFAGRLVFGTLSDILGRSFVQILLLGSTAAIMFLYIGKACTFASFTAATLLIGACYGGQVAVLPALVSDCFGQKYFSSNYSILYAGFPLAGVVGPLVCSLIYQHSGSYQGSFYFIGILALCGCAASGLIRHFFQVASQQKNFI